MVACVAPATPHRSLFNSLAYDSAEALARALPELAAIYADAGVHAWSVWVPEADVRAARLLADAGHAIDAEPAVMCMELGDLQAPRPDDLDLDPEPRVETLAQLNDDAYGTAPDMERAVQFMSGVPIYVARLDGHPVSCVGSP